MGLDDKEQQEQARPESIGADSLPTARRNAIDLNNEIAGHETGRSKKFLAAESPEALRERKREEERLSALMRAMRDREYVAAYKETKDAAENARRAIEAAKSKLDIEAQRAAEQLDEIRQSAARLRDGTRVYVSKADGRLYTEDGMDVSDRREEVTGLTRSSPSYEDMQIARDDAGGIARRLRSIERYENEVLNPIEERLPSEDNPYTLEELEEAKRRITEMPPDVLAEYDFPRAAVPSTKTSAADDYLGSDDFEAPSMNAHFARAASDESHDSSQAPLVPANSPKPG